MRANIDFSAVNNREIEKIMDNIRKKNSPFIIEVYKYLRNIKKNKLNDNIIIYPKEEFVNLGWKDKAIDRVVARYEDIMLCIDVYNKYSEDLIVKNMMAFAEVIRKVAADVDLDRVIYVRIFKTGTILEDKGYVVKRGYCDEYREFNEDILDLLTISLEGISKNGCGEIASIMQQWQEQKSN